MLSEEEMTMFYDCFCVFDSSKRGHINKEKVQCALKTLGFNPKDKQLQRTIFQIDEDSNGRFNFHKFIKIIVALEKEDEEIKSVRDSFNGFDFMGEGFVSANDLKEALLYIMEKASEEDKQNIIKYYKLEKDRKIFFPEFKQMMIPIKTCVSFENSGFQQISSNEEEKSTEKTSSRS